MARSKRLKVGQPHRRRYAQRPQPSKASPADRREQRAYRVDEPLGAQGVFSWDELSLCLGYCYRPFTNYPIPNV